MANFATGSSLENLTTSPILVDGRDIDIHARRSRSSEMSPANQISHGAAGWKRKELLAEILQNVGSMILAAADRSGDDSKKITAFVLYTIANLHHIDAIPSAVYDYSPTNDVKMRQRPPTLHLLSSRILTSLSDAVWRGHERAVAKEAAEVGAEYYYQGHEVPGARWKLRVRELGLEVWMELILWVCLEQRLLLEGGWILREMKKRSDLHNTWSVINWNAVQNPTLRKQARHARVDWDGVKSRIGGVVGGIEGYSSEAPFVELGQRTISSEVICAFVDGLANDFWVGSERPGHSPKNVVSLIHDLKGLLLRDDYGLGVNSWNQLILRIIDSGAIGQEDSPTVFESVLGLAPTYREEAEAISANESGTNQPDLSAYESAATLGFLHRALEARSRSGRVRGALRVFQRLQSLTDLNKNRSISHFMSGLSSKEEREVVENDRRRSVSEVPGLFPEIPTRTLAAFLDLLTEAEVYDFAKWLLYANEIDGPLISEDLYTDPLLIPSLLRFAYATSDSALLSKVVASISKPLPPDISRALIHCQVSSGRWKSAIDMLDDANESKTAVWNAETVTTITRAILKLEVKIASKDARGPQNADPGQYLGQAIKLLQDLLHGDYGMPSLDEQINVTGIEAYFSSLRCVVGSAIPSSSRLSSFHYPAPGKDVRPMSVGSFNVLLRAVSETQGTSHAKELWEMWCQDPPRMTLSLVNSASSANPDMEISNSPENASEPVSAVVIPNVSTVRIIAQGAIREWKHLLEKAKRSNEETNLQSRLDKERMMIRGYTEDGNNRHHSRKFDWKETKATEWYNATFNWSAEMFRRLNLNDEEIEEELSGCVTKRHTRAQMRWRLRF
ncbi:MAG: hypothetical protein M1837_005939 [Sclerophora amabilis]|nr:MAG: hypothetical protein M1837_005939 [Sclerophora amabilis]